MSEDEEKEAPKKKTARKRVVKKGVRGKRAPKKKSAAERNSEGGEERAEQETSPNEESTPSNEVEEQTIPLIVETPEEAALQNESVQQEARKEESQDDDNRGDKGEGDSKGREPRRRTRDSRRSSGNDSEQKQQNRPRIDAEEAAAKAWEIYQGELEEEGVSLVDPRRARDLARRCLELATVFCEERDKYLKR